MRVIVLAVVLGLHATAAACPIPERELAVEAEPEPEPLGRIPAVELALALLGLSGGVLVCRRLAARAS